jgi:hypothetical protein
MISDPNASLHKESKYVHETASGWKYLMYGFLAIVIEIVATAPMWMLIGTHGTDNPAFERTAFILNLPTVLLTWSLGKIIGTDFPLFLLTPFTQIIFWFCVFVYFGYRKRSRLN